MSRTDPMIHIRLAPEVKDFLSSRAKQQERTMGAHITFLLRQEMEKEKAPGRLAAIPDASHAE
ncbi:hypothetical protein [Komagataeibacter oboediens]|uniref:hypothetical protein n=1 Tax=Komagataeibacter oboediens TaxID=65958 RepID=UPI0011B75C37|nr:hypothetical protein [Komagataeibacter oboediens]